MPQVIPEQQGSRNSKTQKEFYQTVFSSMFSAAAQQSPLLQVVASSKWKKYIYIRIHVVYELFKVGFIF